VLGEDVRLEAVNVGANGGKTQMLRSKLPCTRTDFTVGAGVGAACWEIEAVTDPVTKHSHFTKQPAGHHKNGSKYFVSNRPNFASGKGGHYVTENFEEGGRYVTCDKPSTMKPGWMKNTWMDRIGGRMSQ
jgi:hypothetical protein